VLPSPTCSVVLDPVLNTVMTSAVHPTLADWMGLLSWTKSFEI